MRLVVDIDGTICNSGLMPDGLEGYYEKSVPIMERIAIINEHYDNGDYIVYCTARGMGSSDNDATEAYLKYYDLTRQQLMDWGAKYHELFLGKPAGDIYIDDRASHADDFFGDKDG